MYTAPGDVEGAEVGAAVLMRFRHRVASGAAKLVDLGRDTPSFRKLSTFFVHMRRRHARRTKRARTSGSETRVS